MAGTRSASEGNLEVEARLIPQICKELRRLATYHMRFERVNYTSQPAALLANEAYLGFVRQPFTAWHSCAPFFAVAFQRKVETCLKRKFSGQP